MKYLKYVVNVCKVFIQLVQFFGYCIKNNVFKS